MTTLRQSFRKWWQPPRKASEREEERSVRWLLVGAVALTLVCIAILMQSIQIPEAYYALYRRGGILTVVSSLLILVLGFTNLPAIPLLAILVVLMLVPIFYGIKVWIQVLGAEEITIQ